MSRKDEDRILHGLYYFHESIDDEFEVAGDEVLWLAAHSFAEGNLWHMGGGLQSFDSAVIPDHLRHKLIASKCEIPLRYLSHRRLIKFGKTDDGRLQVSVTFAGADRAMRLHTWFGRMELWYQERRNGFLGLVTTIAVSMITALITVLVTERMYTVFAEQTRVIYEVGPKPAP